MIEKLLNCPHLLIAGATGSGKSTLEALLLAELVGKNSPDNELWLIDPKKVELFPWSYSGTCKAYADEPQRIVSLLRDLNNVMDTRYTAMRFNRLTMTTDHHIYCFIDEYSDIVYSGIRRQAEPLLCRLLALGRAARIHIVICTQRPTADIITGMIKANISDRIALHTVNAQDSRNIIGVSGAERLPRYGQAIISLADGTLDRVAVQPLTSTQINNIFNQLGGLKKMNTEYTYYINANADIKREDIINALTSADSYQEANHNLIELCLDMDDSPDISTTISNDGTGWDKLPNRSIHLSAYLEISSTTPPTDEEDSPLSNYDIISTGDYGVKDINRIIDHVGCDTRCHYYADHETNINGTDYLVRSTDEMWEHIDGTDYFYRVLTDIDTGKSYKAYYIIPDGMELDCLDFDWQHPEFINET